MQLAARKPLADAVWALERLDDGVDNATEFRVLWAASVALLRSVGHVLQKVDARRDRRLDALIREFWSRWQSEREKHAIFWEFIEKERNAVLKEYEFGYQHGKVQLVATSVAGSETTMVLSELPATVYAPLLTEAYEGDDARDVALEAVAWWQTQLGEIERAMETQATSEL